MDSSHLQSSTTIQYSAITDDALPTYEVEGKWLVACEAITTVVSRAWEFALPLALLGVPLAQAVEGHVYGYPILNPLGAFGWQGIVPAKAAQMAMTMVEMVTTKLVDVQETFLRLDPRKMAELLAPEVPEMANNVARDMAPRWAADLGAKAVPAQCGPLLASHSCLATASPT